MVLIDPPGSSLFNKVKRGVLYTRHEAEGKRLKNPFDTITEGIGINRITANFSKAQVWALHTYTNGRCSGFMLGLHSPVCRSQAKPVAKRSSWSQLFACTFLLRPRDLLLRYNPSCTRNRMVDCFAD